MTLQWTRSHVSGKAPKHQRHQGGFSVVFFPSARHMPAAPRRGGRALPWWWCIASAWFLDPGLINHFPRVALRAEAIGAIYPRSLRTIQRYATNYQAMMRAHAAASSAVPDAPLVPPAPSPPPSVFSSAPAPSPPPPVSTSAAPAPSPPAPPSSIPDSQADSVDPCADPTTPGARFLRKHGFLRIRLLAADVLRLEVLFRVDHLSQDLLNEIF